MKKKKKQIAFCATVEEQVQIERVKEFYRRHSFSDTIRFLIGKESEKILSENTAMAERQEASK